MEDSTEQTFKLSEADVKAAIKAWVEKKHPWYVDKKMVPVEVTIQVEQHTTGMGMNERDEHRVVVRATRKL